MYYHLNSVHGMTFVSHRSSNLAFLLSHPSSFVENWRNSREGRDVDETSLSLVLVQQVPPHGATAQHVLVP